MSFFDEADEPPLAPRTTPRTRRPAGGGQRPPSDQQAIQVRRIVAVVVILVLIIIVVLGVHSCQVSARNSALKDYANNVSSLIQRSDQTGAQLFGQLGGTGGGNRTALQNQINNTLLTAEGELRKGKGFSVPDEMRAAQTYLVLALQMRRDGIAGIATEIQPALGTSTSQDAINAIATNMARFYASDVVYKGYTTPHIASALHDAGIGVGGTNGVPIEAGQFLPDIQWLQPSFVATKLGAQVSTPTGKPTPGVHGHSVDSVSIAGTTLQPGSTNTVTASPAPTVTLNFTNGGENTEHNVVCKVTVPGTSVSGQTVVTQTTPNQSTSCDVQLKPAPPTGSYQLKATVQPVLGEKNAANNTLTFPVTFQ